MPGSPYSLIDATKFFKVLPNSPGKFQFLNTFNSPYHVDRHGYLFEGESRMSMLHWTKRPFSKDNPYDVDLQINVRWFNNENDASSFIKNEPSRFVNSRSEHNIKIKEVSGHKADEVILLHHENSDIHKLSSRYGNYVFGYIAAINNDGYFPNMDALEETMSRLDLHIQSLLDSQK